MYIFPALKLQAVFIESGQCSKGILKDTYLEFRIYVLIETLLKSMN